VSQKKNNKEKESHKISPRRTKKKFGVEEAKEINEIKPKGRKYRELLGLLSINMVMQKMGSTLTLDFMQSSYSNSEMNHIIIFEEF
jgi:hypothetical protein